MPLIEAHLENAGAESEIFRGAQVLTYQGGAMTSAAAIQVVYDSSITTGDFSITLEAGFRRLPINRINFGTVATIDQTDVNNPITLTIAPGLEYKFVRGSGVAVIAMIG